MTLINEIYATGSITRGELKVFTLLLNLFAPHICEEIWADQKLGGGMVCQQKWPRYDESKCADRTVELVVQVNGKVRSHLKMPADVSKEDALAAARADEKIEAATAGKSTVREIYVPGRLVNLVVR